jgi:hypothetical protein
VKKDKPKERDGKRQDHWPNTNACGRLKERSDQSDKEDEDPGSFYKCKKKKD